MVTGVKATAHTQGFDLEGWGFRPQGPRQTLWACGLAPPCHVHAGPAGPAAWGWPRRHRSRWGRPACARRRTRGVPGVGLGVLDGAGSTPQPQDGRVGPGPHPHLPSSPRKSLVAWPSKFPQSPHTWLLCLCSSRTWGGGGGGRSHPLQSPERPRHAGRLHPPCSSRGPPFLLGHPHFQVGRRPPVKPRPVRHPAGTSDELQELEGGRDRTPRPALPCHPHAPAILTMRCAPGPHTTTSCSSSCLATSRTLWPKGAIWSPLLL